MANFWKRMRKDRPGYDWVADIRDPRGKRHRLSAPTREQAEALLDAKKAEFKRDEKLVGDPALTFGDYAERCLKEMTQEQRLKPRTIASYSHLYKLHIEPTLGARKLRELRRIDVKQLLADKREQKIGYKRTLSKNTVRLIRATLSVLFEEALDDELIEANPTSLRRKGRKKAAPPEPLHPFERDELNAVLEAARENDAEYYPLFLLLARTGLRPGEAFALEWSDVDFSEHKSKPEPRIHVERALSAKVVGTPKTATSVRDVDMSTELAAELKSLYKTREAQALKQGWGEVPELIFITSERGHLDISRIRKRFACVMKKAGVSGHRLYDLRHTFISHLLASNAPITYVSAQAGHKGSKMTLDVYGRWMPNSGTSFVDALDSRPNADSIPAQLGTKVGTRTEIDALKQPETTENAA